MKRVMTVFILGIFAFLTMLPAFSSQDADKKRDPFRDLLVEKEAGEKSNQKGTPQFFIEDIVIKGITRVRGYYIAIANGPQGFPCFIKKGDTFSDGYVYTINETQVIFKQTKQKGIPLKKPKDIIKELYPEER